jgi:phage shock protein C
MDEQNFTYKRLYRSRTERVLLGVCGGLAEYFGVDPVLIRLIFIAFILLGGCALFFYLVMWLIVPLKPESFTNEARSG